MDGGGARKRLAKRGRAMKVCVGHDYIETLRAARRRKHADKQTRLIGELRGMLLEMKAALAAEMARAGTGLRAHSGKGRRRRRCGRERDQSSRAG